MNYKISLLIQRQTKIRYSSGVGFGLWCAILWGLCYHTLGLLLESDSFLLGISNVNPYACGLAISIVLAYMIAAITICWTIFMWGFTDFKNSLFTDKKQSKYYIIAAVTGGVAACATYITAGLTDSLYAVIGTIFYPIVGFFVARRWLKEKMSTQSKLGMGLIAIGWLLIYVPVSATHVSFTAVFLGLLTGIGWGVEGAVVSRILDIHNSETAVAVRYTYEAVILTAVLLVTLLIFPDGCVVQYLFAIASNPLTMLALFSIALCLSFNYLAWYKAFALIGVFSGLVISDISGFIIIVTGLLLASAMPEWNEVFASIAMLLGVYVIYSGNNEYNCLRNVSIVPQSKKTRITSKSAKMPTKLQLLLTIVQRGAIWDFELANLMTEDIEDNRRRISRRNKLRTLMIEACASGMIVSIEDSIDQNGHFQEGKLLSKYQITEYGYKILLSHGLIRHWSAIKLYKSRDRGAF